MDIFENTILCKKCNVKMKPEVVNRKGFDLRAVRCGKCKSLIIHPADLNDLDKFKDLKDKEFNVKLRMVGNSHTISIPKEIVSFMENQHRAMRRQMDDMVKLFFDDFDTLKLRFGDER